ncbi:hypothetical protein G9P44_006233 [Scheffersomyces stipitis]|nr:hypothetical protein G9P44_006233 [Scheffersomyces stipitis]
MGDLSGTPTRGQTPEITTSPRLRTRSPMPPHSYLLRRNTPIRRTPQVSWKKLLYLKQPFPDNYTDQSFLSQLKRNTTVAKYSYIKLVKDFSLIVFYISVILVVVLMFTGIYLHQWSSMLPTMVTSALSISGFIILKVFDKSYNTKVGKIGYYSQRLNMKSFVLIIFILLILSPVLKSLTKSTASDSIWALSFILCVCNTIFHDYSMNSSSSDVSELQYRPIISTNISLSNSIVLASRLGSTSQVFFFVLFSIQVNILLPLFDFNARRAQFYRLHWTVYFIVFNFVNYLIILLLGTKFLFYWFVAVLGIVFLMPAYFLFLQRYKNELQGPWDTAKPIINTN